MSTLANLFTEIEFFISNRNGCKAQTTEEPTDKFCTTFTREFISAHENNAENAIAFGMQSQCKRGSVSKCYKWNYDSLWNFKSDDDLDTVLIQFGVQTSEWG